MRELKRTLIKDGEIADASIAYLRIAQVIDEAHDPGPDAVVMLTAGSRNARHVSILQYLTRDAFHIVC